MSIRYRIKYGAAWTIVTSPAEVDGWVRALISSGKSPAVIRIVPIILPEEQK